jgi:hypothetical protein
MTEQPHQDILLQLASQGLVDATASYWGSDLVATHDHLAHSLTMVASSENANVDDWYQILASLANSQILANELPKFQQSVAKGFKQEYFTVLVAAADITELRRWCLQILESMVARIAELKTLAMPPAPVLTPSNPKFVLIVRQLEAILASEVKDMAEIDRLLSELERILMRNGLNRDIVSAYSLDLYQLTSKLSSLYNIKNPKQDIRATIRTGWREVLKEIFATRDRKQRIQRLIAELKPIES